MIGGCVNEPNAYEHIYLLDISPCKNYNNEIRNKILKNLMNALLFSLYPLVELLSKNYVYYNGVNWTK